MTQTNQNNEVEKPPQKSKLKRLVFLMLKTYPKTMRYIKEETNPNITPIAEDFRSLGVSEETIALGNQVFATLHKAGHNPEADIKLNRYTLGGISILNLVLLQVLTSLGRTGIALSIAWIAFVVSLPCTAGALFLSSKHGKIKNLLFPLIYNISLNLSLFGCGVSVTALIWHFWDIAGWIFAILATTMYLLCIFYELITRIREVVLQEQHDTEQGTNP